MIVDSVLNSFAPAGLTTYVIPDSVTKIGDFAFYYCYELTSVTIPNSVTMIGRNAFAVCGRLASIYCKPTTPPAVATDVNYWSAFDSNASDRTIYVPHNSVEAYKTAPHWSDYADAIVGYNFGEN